MKTKSILYVLIGGSLVALLWAAFNAAPSVSVEQVIGYGAVLALLAMAASSYGIRPKKLFR
jgi:ammonia channel protein AmtB